MYHGDIDQKGNTMTNTAELTTYSIHPENYWKLTGYADDLNKRAVRLGYIAKGEQLITITHVGTKQGPLDDNGFPEYLFQVVTIEGELPTVGDNDWELLGTVSMDRAWGENENAVNLVPGTDATVDEAWYTIDVCTHCDRNIATRQKLIIVRDTDGNVELVGTTCIKDYLGWNSVENFASWLNNFDELVTACDTEEWFDIRPGCKDPYVVSLTDVVSAALVCIAAYGWSSAKSTNPTRGSVESYVWPTTLDRKSGLTTRDYINADAAKAGFDLDTLNDKLAYVMGWLADQDFDKDNEFERKIMQLVDRRNGGLRRNELGIACYLAEMPYATEARRAERKAAVDAREAAKAERTEASTAAGYLGEIKDRVEVAIEVASVKHLENNWGSTTLIKGKTNLGQVVTWFASGYKDIAPGTLMAGKATIKKLDEFNGELQTVVTRFKYELVDSIEDASTTQISAKAGKAAQAKADEAKAKADAIADAKYVIERNQKNIDFVTRSLHELNAEAQTIVHTYEAIRTTFDIDITAEKAAEVEAVIAEKIARIETNEAALEADLADYIAETEALVALVDSE